MAETLTELVARIIVDATELQKGLSEAQKAVEGLGKTVEKETKSIKERFLEVTHGVQSWVEENKKQFKAVGATLAGVGVAITGTFGLAVKSAMETQAIRIAFENLASSAGQSSEELLKSLKDSSKGTIAEYDLMLSANKAMVLGVAQNSEQFASLMEIARDRARAMGLTTTQAFNDIVTGIGRGSRMILDNLGIIVSLETANEEYAKSLGKTAEALTEDEKKQALLNAVLEQGQETIDKTSQSTMTASEMFQSLKATISDFSAKIGSFLIPILESVLDKVVPIIEKVQAWTDAHPELTRVLIILAAVLGGVALVLGPILIMLPMLVAGFGLLLGPVGLVVAAIMGFIAIGTLLVLNWETIKTKTVEIWDSIVGFLKGIWDNIVGFFGENWDKILAILFPAVGLPILIARNWDSIRTKTIEVWEGIKNFFADVWQNIISIFKNHWQLILAILFPPVGLPLLIAKNWGVIVGIVSGIFSHMGEAIEINFKGAVNSVIDLINNLIDFVAGVKISFPGLSVLGKEIIPAFEWALPPIPHLPRLAKGGIVTQPTLAMIGESGSEAVTPLNRTRGLGDIIGAEHGAIIDKPALTLMGEQAPSIREAVIPETIWDEIGSKNNIIVQFSQPVFFDREDTMNKFVDMISKGIDRKQRLRFGGAYSG